MKLRTRLLLGLLGLVAVGLLVSDVVTYRSLKSFLYDRIDQQLAANLNPLYLELGGSRRLGPGHDGPTATSSSAPVGTWAALFDSSGQVYKTGVIGYGDQDPDSVFRPKYTTASLSKTGPVTVDGVGGNGKFRMLVSGTSDGGAVLVAIPLHDVNQTLGRLIGVEGAATLIVLAAVGLMSRLLVRSGLRPLEDISATAGAIAGGDLSRRVDHDDSHTEVGQLGQALNKMLGHIQSAFESQQESEDRLRRFIADASHELRTPLTSIRGYAELFRRGAADRPEDLAKAMRRIEQEAARMGVLVDDLLLLARLDQGRPLERQRVDLVRIAADAADDARAVEPDRPITLLAPSTLSITGDDVRLRQVVGNLLTNARQHTPAGTPVTVSVSAVGDTAASRRAVLEVADRGPGLPAEQAARVFERFYRADSSRTRAQGGTGLGLAIVAAIAEAHGGKATVDSIAGYGARFRIELPIDGDPPPATVPEPAPSTDQAPTPSPAPSQQG